MGGVSVGYDSGFLPGRRASQSDENYAGMQSLLSEYELAKVFVRSQQYCPGLIRATQHFGVGN